MSELTMYPLSLEERNGMIQIYSDFHKDAYGFRPRYDYPSFSDEELISDFNYFGEVCKDNAKEEEAFEQARLKDWNTLVEKTIGLGANDRKTALRWLLNAELEDENSFIRDVEDFVWSLHISHTDDGRELTKELNEILDEAMV
jgi:uncharacterized protein YwqG